MIMIIFNIIRKTCDNSCKIQTYIKLGPSTWGNICDIANTGENQSPIDLSDAIPFGHDPLELTDAYFQDMEGSIFNNGHTGNLT